MAALNTYNLDLCIEICERVSNGENIKAILDSDKNKYPTFKTFCNWKRDNIELLHLYTRSREDKAEIVDSEIDAVIKKLTNGQLDPASARVIIDAYKWKASKYYPKMYGEKLDVTSMGEKLEDKVIEVVVFDNTNQKK